MLLNGYLSIMNISEGSPDTNKTLLSTERNFENKMVSLWTRLTTLPTSDPLPTEIILTNEYHKPKSII